MHAWAALKPADIVQAARALRELLAGTKPDEEVQAGTPARASPVAKDLSREIGAAE